MPDAADEQVGDVEGQLFQRVLVHSLRAVEVVVLVRRHLRVLDAVLPPALADLHHLPEVEHHGGRGGQGHVAIVAVELQYKGFNVAAKVMKIVT